MGHGACHGACHDASRFGLAPRHAPGRVSPEDLETVPTAELLSELKRRKPGNRWTRKTHLDAAGIPMN